MKLPFEVLTVEQKVEEFDSWLTPQLHEIKGTEKFKHELRSIGAVIECLAGRLNNFASIDDCALPLIRDAVISATHEMLDTSGLNTVRSELAAAEFVLSFFGLLFLVTGATDNNLKNHFTIKLRQDGFSPEFPEKIGRLNVSFRLKPFGNTVTSRDIAAKLARAIVGCRDFNLRQEALTSSGIDLKTSIEVLLFEYISLIVADRNDVSQFWAVCKSYIDCRAISEDAAHSLITPAVIFKVRGSVSASAGHLPEEILREKLILIGLEPGRDFNTSDAIIGIEPVIEAGEVKKKTRAYDFVLPFEREGWQKKIFIQSQFYAGDSGSVSHKVVDQTVSSRQYTSAIFPGARFVEYLDGAGYFASLRGDLLHMMRMTDTHSFIQVRSLWIRLRRELQLIGFITPVEVEHAIMRTEDGDISSVREILLSEGYSEEEISRSLSYAIDKALVSDNFGKLAISPGRKALARRLFIIDTIACIGGVIVSSDEMSKSISIPGYGASFGVNQAILAASIDREIKYERVSIPDYSLDMEWLIEEKAVKKIM
ncbi:hypothetical protein AEQ67_12315 [Pseudomonas sp. RIT-PI-q]|uniref:hypothetical protein n=1 Tax=Pseudomonas sp. RIT-PI-q TaxID=1690247 RepID=UPI0006CC40A4|nr:hypothetical protein [Pseudomonas sp. RIT-PI-q]KPG98951.1 hypothetical protein AEQ67_12315 [Pseudomonas sp. RIT-PI-q]